MISIFALFLSLTIIGLILMQSVFVFSYVSFLTNGHTRSDAQNSKSRNAEQRGLDEDSRDDAEADYTPKAAIILCLRGADDTLSDCLTGILSQIYPAFELHLAFDNEDDPSRVVVEEFFERKKFQPTQHTFEPRPECSLKCSAIIHVVERLDPSIEVVTFVDCDTIIDHHWLADLVNPLKDERIGATTGNRWFTPEERDERSFIQRIWNAAAVVQMYKYDVAWGGSLAMRRDVIDQCGLLEKWSRSFCEDTSLSRPFRRHGYRLHRVHDLVLDNNEPATSSQTFEWMVRQLLTVKLHHQRWPEIVTHGILTGLTSFVAPLAVIFMLVTGYTVAGLAIFKAWVVYQVFNLTMLWLIENSNQEILDERNAFNRVADLPNRTFGEFVGAAMAAQFLHPLAVLQALFTNRIDWRGVTYAISGNRLKVLSIEPSTPTDEDEDHPEAMPRIVSMHAG